jgi:hypothetical protein
VLVESLCCSPIAEIPLSHCQALFTACRGRLLYICVCFCADTHVFTLQGRRLQRLVPAPWDGECAVHFGELGGGLLVVTERSVRVVDAESGEVRASRQFSTRLVAAAHCAARIAVGDVGRIRILSGSDLHKEQTWNMKEVPVLLAISETHIAIVSVENSVRKIDIESLAETRTWLPEGVGPVSVALTRDGGLLIGTFAGGLLSYSPDLATVLPDQVGPADSRVMLHTLPDGSVIGSGSPPFQYDDHLISLSCCDCEDIAKSGNYIACLHSKGIAVFAVTDTVVNISRLLLPVPGLGQAFGNTTDPSEIFCFVETANHQHSIVKYRCTTEIAKYDHPANSRASLFVALDFEGRPLLLIGDDKPSITLLDDQFRVVANQKMFGLPTAACLFMNFLVVARPGYIDFFNLTNLDDNYEMERKSIAEGHSIAPDLIVANNFLVASDQAQSLIVYALHGDAIVRVADDTLPKRLNKLAYIEPWIFAASYGSAVYCYRLESDGSIREVGAFQCDSAVLALCVIDTKLWYGTAGGGIGVFEPTADDRLVRLRDALEKENLTLRPDRTVHAMFEWAQVPLFVDFDTLGLVRKLPPKDVERILRNARLTADQLSVLPV